MNFEQLASRMDMARLPAHIAIIMDGNGRWAEAKGLSRVEGHREGVRRVDEIVTFCRKIGVKALTLYSFSSENWRRPPEEVSTLMNILKMYIQKELRRMLKENVRFNTIGRIGDLPAFAREPVLQAVRETKDATGMTLTLALSYGSRDEIMRAVRHAVQDAAEGLITPDDLDEDAFSQYLDTGSLADPDLLIRTSGELRISNFLLWQIAYTELYFSDKLWPEFTAADVAEAIVVFQGRERRFGRTQAQLSGGKE